MDLSLDDVIQLARDQSPMAILAQHRYRSSYWEYRTFRAKYLPGLTLSTTIPDLTRSIERITTDDGSDVFVPRKIVNSSMDMSLTQNLAFSGGSIFMSSGLERIDPLGSTTSSSSYLSTPVSIGFRQPIMGNNTFKWEKQIEPIKYEQAKKVFIDAMEDVNARAVNYFFNLALAQRDRGETDKALETVDEAIDREKDAPYLVLKAKLAADKNDKKMAKQCLDEAFKRFESIFELSDWELHWYISAAKMAKDDGKLKKAEEERKRRISNKKESAKDDSVLPAVKAGALKKVA